MNAHSSLSFSSIRRVAVASAVAISTIMISARAESQEADQLPDVVMTASPTTGFQAFADLGAPVANTGNINTATTLTIGNLISTSGQSGYFFGMTNQLFGPVAFDPSVGSSLSFGNATFGSFLSTSITQQTNTAGERSFLVLGNFTGGAFGGVTTPNPAPSSLTISFTQTPAGTGAISDSASLAIPGVPEPASYGLLLAGLAGGGYSVWRRRHG